MMTRDKIQTVLDALAKPWKHEQVEAAIEAAVWEKMK